MTRPVRPVDLHVFDPAPRAPGGSARFGVAVPGPALFAVATLALAAPVVVSLVATIDNWTPWSVLAVLLTVPSLLWIAGGAASALIGLAAHRDRHRPPPPGWVPPGEMAVLVTLCDEDPIGAATRIAALHADLSRLALDRHATLFVLSDTRSGAVAEANAFAPLIGSGKIRYRHRPRNHGRKPGNIAEWFARHGAGFETMLVLDADSRMSAARIRDMAWRMARAPRLGLLQAGLALVPARTRFGRMQRVSVRLLGPGFARGFAAWSGNTANYWGHNALIRTRAFAAAARLPQLPGRAPLGGDILSHDIIEAAFIRRAGWHVAFDPDASGSAEDGPQTLSAWHQRDRRWCQGNLQHARLLAEPGLSAVSRLHIAAGIFGYLAGGIWLLLIVLMAGGLLSLGSVLPFALVAVLLLLPKLAGLYRLAGPGSTPWRRRIALRAAASELAMSSCLAPTIMLRHAVAVLSVLAGRDCGWKSPARRGPALPPGWAEAGFGLGLAALAAWTGPAHLPWLLPVLVPLLAAPILVPALDAPA